MPSNVVETLRYRLTDLGRLFQRRRVPPGSVLDALDSRHLLRREPRGNGFVYEISHDRLVEPIRKSNAKFFDDERRKQSARVTKLVVCLFLVGALFLLGDYVSSANRMGDFRLWKHKIDEINRNAISRPDNSIGFLVDALKTPTGIPATVPPSQNWPGFLFSPDAEESAAASYSPQLEITRSLFNLAFLSPNLNRVLTHPPGLLAIHIKSERIAALSETGDILVAEKDSAALKSVSAGLVKLDGWTNQLEEWRRQGAYAVGLAQEPNDGYVIAAGAASGIWVWKVKPGAKEAKPQVVSDLRVKGAYQIHALAISPDGNMIAVGLKSDPAGSCGS